MKIKFKPYPLQLCHTFTVAIHSRSVTPDVLLELEHEGYIGYGEAALPPYLGETPESVCNFLSKIDMNKITDPTDIESTLAYIDHIATGNCAAKAAFDIALHDLVGKIKGRSWVDIWGLSDKETPLTTYTIGIDTPSTMQSKVKEIGNQFKRLKVKVGMDNDKELIQAIREVSDLPLTVDANQGWTDKHEALDNILWMQEQGVILIEQPLKKDRLDDIAWITERSPLPIFADESCQRLADLPSLIGVFSGINIKLMKCTGMHEAYKMIQEARKSNMQVMLGCMTETSCAISAATQLSSLVDYADLDGNLLISNDPFKGAYINDGRICNTTAPGIGLL